MNPEQLRLLLAATMASTDSIDMVEFSLRTDSERDARHRVLMRRALRRADLLLAVAAEPAPPEVPADAPRPAA